jgi:hypothetical protein
MTSRTFPTPDPKLPLGITGTIIPVQSCRLLELKGLTMYRITKRPPLLMAILLAAILIVS